MMNCILNWRNIFGKFFVALICIWNPVATGRKLFIAQYRTRAGFTYCIAVTAASATAALDSCNRRNTYTAFSEWRSSCYCSRNSGSIRHAKQERFHPDISPSPQQPPCCSNNSSLSGLQPSPVTVATTFVPSVGGGSTTSIACATLNTSPLRIDSR